jgi:prepilin-type N-terminal cleavage/methylation domain-containing protein
LWSSATPLWHFLAQELSVNLIPRRPRAFTLIELIVVIVVMSILVAIGSFAYNVVIDHSHKASARAVAEQVARSVQGVSASTGTAAAAMTPDVRIAAVSDAADVDAVVTWSDDGSTAQVAREGFCTLVNFPTSPGGRGVLDETVSGSTCESVSASDPSGPARFRNVTISRGMAMVGGAYGQLSAPTPDPSTLRPAGFCEHGAVCAEVDGNVDVDVSAYCQVTAGGMPLPLPEVQGPDESTWWVPMREVRPGLWSTPDDLKLDEAIANSPIQDIPGFSWSQDVSDVRLVCAVYLGTPDGRSAANALDKQVVLTW